MRIFAISDIHIDFKENVRWLESLSNADYVDDALILAGDISDSTPRTAKCFEQLCSKFKFVFYVPGNHDIWVRRDSHTDSINKFSALLALAHEHGVITEQRSFHDIAIIPLFSWYDLSFGEMSEALVAKWMDFTHCKWPEALETPSAQNSFFLQKNEIRKQPDSKTVITFSHFLPRIDLMPSYIPERFQDIYPVLGSPLLDQQIRDLDSNIHIYGHSHVNCRTTIDSIEYINNAFGYPSEAHITAKRLLEITY
ncbi:MAG: metallophosphoesterase [Candidatus Thiodiazotropha sp. LLP2]